VANEITGEISKDQSITSLKNGIARITMLFIKKIIESLDHYDEYFAYKKATSLPTVRYILNLRDLLIQINDYNTGNTAIHILPKLLFRDLSILNDFGNRGFIPCTQRLHAFPYLNSSEGEELENYLRMVKIHFVNYYKIVLKEFDLLKFYQQLIKISDIKLKVSEGGEEEKNKDLSPFQKEHIEKLKDIHYLINKIYCILQDYDDSVFVSYETARYHPRKELINFPPTFYYIAFYYRIKLVNLLLKQYKEIINDDELRQKINMKLFINFSVILIFSCVKEIVRILSKIIENYYFGFLTKNPIGKKDLQKILKKMTGLLNNVYFVLPINQNQHNENVFTAIYTIYKNVLYEYHHTRIFLENIFNIPIENICRNLSYHFDSERRQHGITVDSNEYDEHVSMIETVNELYLAGSRVSQTASTILNHLLNSMVGKTR